MKLKLFILENCPHCIKARGYLSELLKDPKYQAVEIELIDENKQSELANSYDYYYVPTFFYHEKKLFEGSMTKKDVQNVLDEVLSI
ncbi:MAG: thioredoxin family protein [Erysipelotrichaceae bacterium]